MSTLQRGRATGWLAWSLFAGCLTLYAATLIMDVARGEPYAPMVLAFLVTPAIGALVASRQPQNAVGWLLLEQASIAFPKLAGICKTKSVDMQDFKAMVKLCDEDDEARFLGGKIGVARFYARRALTQCGAKADVLKGGDLSPLETPL